MADFVICPNCKAEYKHGIYVCADCDVPLVDVLPDDESSGSAEFQENVFTDVFITSNAGEIAMIKSLLDDAGIDYYFQGERFASVHSGAYPSRLFVRADQCEEVLEILRDLHFSVFGDTDETNG